MAARSQHTAYAPGPSFGPSGGGTSLPCVKVATSCCGNRKRGGEWLGEQAGGGGHRVLPPRVKAVSGCYWKGEEGGGHLSYMLQGQ